MTVEAVTDFKVQLTFMAVAAIYLSSITLRWMLWMAVETTDFRSMFSSPFGNHLRLKHVTFLAISRFQFDSLSSKCRGTERNNQQGKRRPAFYAAKRYQPALPENQKVHNPLNALSRVRS